jgi:hypothetical protein
MSVTFFLKELGETKKRRKGGKKVRKTGKKRRRLVKQIFIFGKVV